MAVRLTILVIALLAGIHACTNFGDENNEPWVALPTIISVSGPMGSATDVDDKRSIATINPGTFTNVRPFLRYATSVPDLDSPAASEPVVECIEPAEEPSEERQCLAVFPNRFDRYREEAVSGAVFSSGTTVWYRWSIEYSLPGGTDVAYVVGDVRSFTIEPPQACAEHADCGDAGVCVQDPIALGPDSPGAPLVCRAAHCPRGFNGQICNGDGQCTADGCQCDPDYRGDACETVCQRCYGAIGNNCGTADGFNFGFCGPDLDGDGRITCNINVGSWTHDQCCILTRVNGPSPEQGSCGGPFPEICQAEWDLAVAHLSVPGLTWTREDVDPNFEQCIAGGNTTLGVDHDRMCNPSGGTLLCEHERYCCSRSATPLVSQPQPSLGLVCSCD
jgi:hypothetical protein